MFDILCTNSTSHSIENPPPYGMDHRTLHTVPVGNSGCHLLERCENMRHRSTANPKQTSTVATLETTLCVGRRLVRTTQQRQVLRWARETTREDKGISSSVGGLTSDVHRVSMEKSGCWKKTETQQTSAIVARRMGISPHKH